MRKEAAKRELKQERAARTRVDIMEAAITLFARRGILATTMAELAKAIRMTPGALYWHVPTMEDLLLAAIEELHERFLNEFKELLGEKRKPTARQQREAFMERTQQFLRYHRQCTDVDAHVTAHAIIGGFLGALMHQNLFRESLAYDPLYAVLERLVADGILTR